MCPCEGHTLCDHGRRRCRGCLRLRPRPPNASGWRRGRGCSSPSSSSCSSAAVGVLCRCRCCRLVVVVVVLVVPRLPSSSSFWLVVFVPLWRCRLPFLGCRWRLVASPSSPLLSSIDIIIHLHLCVCACARACARAFRRVLRSLVFLRPSVRPHQ